MSRAFSNDCNADCRSFNLTASRNKLVEQYEDLQNQSNKITSEIEQIQYEIDNLEKEPEEEEYEYEYETQEILPIEEQGNVPETPETVSIPIDN